MVACSCCGREFWFRSEDAKAVLEAARRGGWKCAPVNAKDRSEDTCPRCLSAYVVPGMTITDDMRQFPVVPVPAPKVSHFRDVLEAVLAEEVKPGVTAGEEVARKVVEAARDGDRASARLCFLVMDGAEGLGDEAS